MSLTSVRKVGPVLDLFSPEKPEWRLMEISRELGVPKSSTFSLVKTLVELGLLETDSRGAYRLGSKVLCLAERMRAVIDVDRYALGPMEELSGELEETVLLAVLDGQHVIYRQRVEGHHPTVRLAGVKVGARLPAHCTSVGKVLLAFRDPLEVETLYGEFRFKRLTSRTIGDVAQLTSQLDQIREEQLAFDRGEAVAEVACAAVPVRDPNGTVIAAMSVAMPNYRFAGKLERTILGLRTAVYKTTQALTAHDDDHFAAPAFQRPLALAER